MSRLAHLASAALLSAGFCGGALAQAGPTFTPGETGNRYDLCYPVAATGRPIVSSIPDSACKLLEFDREDCEAIVRASNQPVVNQPPCFAFRQEDVRPKPAASIAAAIAAAHPGYAPGELQ